MRTLYFATPHMKDMI